MKVLSREDFEARYPRPGIQSQVVCRTKGTIVVRQTTNLRGLLHGDIVVDRDAQLLLEGEVVGRLVVASDAVAYIIGKVQGDVHVSGNAFIQGEVTGDVIGAAGSNVYVFGTVQGLMKGIES